jgi:hypothetical protein
MVSNAFSLLQGLMQKLQLAKLKPVSQWSARLIRMLEVSGQLLRSITAGL